MTRAFAAPSERAATIELPGGALDYLVRRSPRSRGVRVTIDPRRGVIVTVPVGRPRQGRLDATVADFLRTREAWIRRHLARTDRDRDTVAALGGLADGALFRFRGGTHRLRIAHASTPQRRSTVRRDGAVDGDELVVTLAARDRRALDRVLREWLVERAREVIDREIACHAPALGVTPATVAILDPRSRWGSATPGGRVMLSWRLVLAPPEALETVVVHELAHLRVAGHGPAFWSLVASRRPDHMTWRRWLREHSFELHSALDKPAD
jgi:predicted metal-dependent hydrolase